jgi:hypothetical protein
LRVGVVLHYRRVTLKRLIQMNNEIFEEAAKHLPEKPGTVERE